jgi:biotin carboxyl carrier protein
MKKLRVTIEGKSYDVLVELLDEVGAAVAPTPAPASAQCPPSTPAVQAPVVPISTATKPAGGIAGNVDCPLTGKVVSIDVKVGDMVKEGGQVATVEAMKMNTYIYAHGSGKVSSIFVNAGDGVEEGAALLQIA